MDIKKLDCLSTKDLRAVTVLADVLHFHRAASFCNISQPAFSSIIKKVESTLQMQLFKRDSRRCVVTEEGQLAINTIRAALGTLETLTASTKNPKTPLSGSLRLGFIPTIGPYLIPQLIRPLLKKYPELALSFSETVTDNLVEMLLRRELDAALVALPILQPRIEVQPLFQEELLLAAPADHAFSKQKKISIDQINQADLLLMDQAHCLRSTILESCTQSQANARTIHSTGLDTLLFMVQAGVGYTIVPSMAAEKYPAKKGISYRTFKNPPPTRTIAMISLKDSACAADVNAFANFIRRSRQ